MERRGWKFLLLLPLAAVLGIFLVLPLLFVLYDSFWAAGRLSAANYLLVFRKGLYSEALRTSLVLSVSTAFIGAALGLPLSYLVHRSRAPWRDLLLAITAVPLTFSGLVIGFAFIVLLGTSGFITMLLERFFGINPLEFSAFLFTWKGLVVAYLYFLIPRMILTMVAAWSNADWSQVEAAMSLGASFPTILVKILFPMLGPSLLAGSSLLFAVSMGAFGTAFALTGTAVKILPLVIYNQISDVTVEVSRANALAIVLTVVTTLVIVLYERSFARKQA
ncbi:MAG TPA: ABC transporter permease subunit [Synergistales bacterium]|mgnify:FL=1|nr:ABC transporter permease subunit [Synergistales bacterium]